MSSRMSHAGATTAPTLVLASLIVITPISISTDSALAATCPSCHPQGNNVVVSCLSGDEVEMSIAINPTDPDNLVIIAHPPELFGQFDPPDCQCMHTFFSLDSGMTWAINPLDHTLDGRTAATFRFDPTVAIDSGGNVYVGYGTIEPGGRRLIVAKSLNGGQTYMSPPTVVDGPVDGLDKWIVNTGPDPDDPNQQNVYIAYTKSTTNNSRHELHLAASYDGGGSFLTNVIVNNALALSSGIKPFAAMPAVAGNGRLYVVWNEWDFFNLFADPPVPPGDFSRIMIDFSDDAGRTFDGNRLIQTTRVSPGHPNGISTTIRYAIPAQPRRGIFAMPSIAIDRSGGAFHGRIYVAYTVVNELNNPIDPFDTDIEVAYIREDDVMQGLWTWTTVRVNDTPPGTSQFLPWLDVDPVSGHVVVMWYDARDDTLNNEQVEVFIGLSTDGGATWRNRQLSDGASSQGSGLFGQFGQDFLEYNGVAIYDAVVHAAWADNSCADASTRFDLDIFTTAVHLRRLVDAAAPDPAPAIRDGKNWATAYQSLQDALSDAAADPVITEIRVADGAYMPDGGFTPVGGTHTPGSGVRSATFQLVSGVAVRGGFRGVNGLALDPNERNPITFVTTLTGDLANDDVASVLELSSGDTSRADNSFHVVTGSGTGPTAILDGFTIRGGNADVDPNLPDGWGGGMLNFDANVTSSPTVLSCTFTDNRAFIGGGMMNQNGDPHVINCRFLANAAVSFAGRPV